MSETRRDMLKTVGAAGIAGLAGCSGKNQSGETETPTGATTSSKEKLNPSLGIITGLTGPYSSLGKEVVKGMELAVKKINEKGGINGEEIKVHTADSELDPKVSVRKAQRLIEEKNVNFIGGNVSTAAGIAVRKVAVERNDGVLHCAAASSMRLLKDLCHKHFFNFTPNPWMGIRAPLDYLVNNRDVSSVYTISADYAWPQSMVKVTKQSAPDFGLEFKGNAYAPLGASDYSTQITKAMDSGADFLQLHLAGADIIKCSNQLLDFGAGEEFNTIHQPYQSLSNYKAMNDMAPFTPSAQFWWQAPGADAWVKEFESEYGEVPDHNSTRYHESAIIPLSIAQELGTVNPSDIAAEMEGWSTDDFFKGGKAVVSADHHQGYSRLYILDGKPKSEMEGPNDYVDYIDHVDTIDYAPEPFDECDAPFFK